jgi:hypothetical protein
MTQLTVTLFRNGREAFLSLLSEHNIEYVEEPIEPGTIKASGEVICIVGAALAAARLVAPIVVEWVRGRATRKVIVRAGLKTVHIEGDYSIDQVKELLEKTLPTTSVSLMMVQTDKDET